MESSHGRGGSSNWKGVGATMKTYEQRERGIEKLLLEEVYWVKMRGLRELEGLKENSPASTLPMQRVHTLAVEIDGAARPHPSGGREGVPLQDRSGGMPSGFGER